MDRTTANRTASYEHELERAIRDMAGAAQQAAETIRALRESHAGLLAALREIGSVCNCGLYDTKANRTHMKWCSVVVAKAAIAKAEASNGDS